MKKISFTILVKLLAKDILLSDQNTWDRRYKNIKISISDYLWKYYDPDNESIFIEPVLLVEFTIEILPPAPLPAPGPVTWNNQQLEETLKQQAS